LNAEFVINARNVTNASECENVEDARDCKGFACHVARFGK